MIDREEVAQTLITTAQVPPVKARRKAASLGRGIVLAVAGAFFMLLAAGLVLVPILLLEEMPGLAFIIFAGFFGVIGMYLIFGGGHIISGEAMEAASAQQGMLIKGLAKAIAMVRKKEG